MSFITQEKHHYLNTPIQEQGILKFKCGEVVLISGYVYTMRDASAKLLESIALPINLEGEIIYFCGPIVYNNIVLSCGPTTTKRLEFIIPKLLSLGVKGFIGKGYISDDTINFLKKHKAIYFITCGGAGALLARSIKEVQQIAFHHLSSQAIFRFKLQNLFTVVAVNAYGEKIFPISTCVI